MGSIIAMVAVVAVVAGLATATTNKLHGVFTGGKPSDKGLQRTLDEWRLALKATRAALVRLKPGEMDLLALDLAEDRKLLKARNRRAGYFQTIYAENVALYVRHDYPRAKVRESVTLVQTADREYVFRQRGADTFVTIDGGPVGVLRGGELSPSNGQGRPVAMITPQRDERTLHVDRGERTLGILVRPGLSRQVVPRAFALVDLREDDDRRFLEALTFEYLLSESIPA